jgi:hypothetical protein
MPIWAVSVRAARSGEVPNIDRLFELAEQKATLRVKHIFAV